MRDEPKYPKVGDLVECIMNSPSKGEQGIVTEVNLCATKYEDLNIENHGFIEVEITKTVPGSYSKVGDTEDYVLHNWSNALKIVNQDNNE